MNRDFKFLLCGSKHYSYFLQPPVRVQTYLYTLWLTAVIIVRIPCACSSVTYRGSTHYPHLLLLHSHCCCSEQSKFHFTVYSKYINIECVTSPNYTKVKTQPCTFWVLSKRPAKYKVWRMNVSRVLQMTHRHYSKIFSLLVNILRINLNLVELRRIFGWQKLNQAYSSR